MSARDREKRQAIEQLAAGVAHEVNNPLMTLLTGVRVLQQRGAAGDGEITLLLEDMAVAVKRADGVIKQLMEFADPAPLAVVPGNLNRVVADAVDAITPDVTRRGATLELDLAADLPSTGIDSPRLTQALVQVLGNAVHATPRGGKIMVRTAFKEREIVLEVDDSGPGLADDTLQRAFDPFFTTKPPGAGTGMGLAVARQIVEMHGGTIGIANRTAGGTRVTITCPRTKVAS